MEFRIEKEDGIATITLCQPKKLNALSVDGLRAYGEAIAALTEGDTVRAIIVTGEGRAFCVGADLSSILGYAREGDSDKVSADAMDKVMREGVGYMAAQIRACTKPTVAAVNGVVAGGGLTLALGCDVVLSVENASFNAPFVPGLGIVPDCGSSWLLTRLAGTGRALPTILLGEPIPAQKALDWGMIWEIVDADDLMTRAIKLARRLTAGPIRTHADVRDAVEAATQHSFTEHLELERKANVELAQLSNFTEGVNAFIEKRAPKFSAKRD